MTIRLPIQLKWTQTNQSDRFGSLWYTKNINLDETGYLKLSPRTVNLFDNNGSDTNTSNPNFDVPVAFGRYEAGKMRIATIDEPFNLEMSNTQKSILEDTTPNNPNLTSSSHGVWFGNKYHESTATAVSSNNAGTWTANVITGLSSGSRHYMTVFRNKSTLVVTDGNQVRQFNASYVEGTALVLPTDFKATGVAYNGNQIGVITKLGTDTAGQNNNAYFFIWSGSSADADQGVSLAGYAGVCVFPYKSSFGIITSTGQILYWNGGGLVEIASFPFYREGKQWGDLLSTLSYGDNVIVDGEMIYINLGFSFQPYEKKSQDYSFNNPSGVWCYDPQAGLYHRSSPSLSRSYFYVLTSSNISLVDGTFSTATVIPETGNPFILTTLIGGFKLGVIYYVIRINAGGFKLAATKADADAGIYILPTSVLANNYLWGYDLVDFGATHSVQSGGIAFWGTQTNAYKNIIFGGRYANTDLTDISVLNTAVPYLGNRGYFVTSKISSSSVSDNFQKIYVKYRTLTGEDKIVIKYKNKDITGLPVSTPQLTTSCSWTSNKTFTTTADFSEAKTYFDANGSLDCEILDGAGAGQIEQITAFTYLTGTYTITLANNVVGAVLGRSCDVLIDNWSVLQTSQLKAYIDSRDDYGYKEFPLDMQTPWLKLKVELQGIDTTIEEIQIINKTQQDSK